MDIGSGVSTLASKDCPIYNEVNLSYEEIVNTYGMYKANRHNLNNFGL